VPKFFALNSYSSFPFSPAFLPLRQNKNPIAPNNASPAMIAPTAIPAFAPVDRPPPPSFGLADGEADSPVLAVALELGVGAINPSLVTLKHGTWIVKSFVSTNVCVFVSTYVVYVFLLCTYNIGTSKKGLVFPIIFAFEFRPIL
jgi:hypothetical protein